MNHRDNENLSNLNVSKTWEEIFSNQNGVKKKTVIDERVFEDLQTDYKNSSFNDPNVKNYNEFKTNLIMNYDPASIIAK